MVWAEGSADYDACRCTSIYYSQVLADGAAFEGFLARTKPLLALTKPLIAFVSAIPDGAALEGVRAAVDEALIHARRHSVDGRKRLRGLRGFSSGTPAGACVRFSLCHAML